MSGSTVTGGEGALIQSINNKLEQITERARTIQNIGEQSATINRTILPSISQIKERIKTLKASIIQIAEAKRLLQETLKNMDPRLDEIVRLLGDNIEAINVDGLQRELETLSLELEQLERAVETANLPNTGAMPPGSGGEGGVRPPRPPRPSSRPAPRPSSRPAPEGAAPELLTPEQIARGQEPGSGQGGGYVFSGKRGAKTRKSTGRKSSGRKSSGRKSTRRKSSGRKSTRRKSSTQKKI